MSHLRLYLVAADRHFAELVASSKGYTELRVKNHCLSVNNKYFAATILVEVVSSTDLDFVFPFAFVLIDPSPESVDSYASHLETSECAFIFTQHRSQDLESIAHARGYEYLHENLATFTGITSDREKEGLSRLYEAIEVAASAYPDPPVNEQQGSAKHEEDSKVSEDKKDPEVPDSVTNPESLKKPENFKKPESSKNPEGVKSPKSEDPDSAEDPEDFDHLMQLIKATASMAPSLSDAERRERAENAITQLMEKFNID